MSFSLFKNGVEVATSYGWNPILFGNITKTSFPQFVSQDWVWENDEYSIKWVEDPEAVIDPNSVIRNKIAELEDTITSRRLREAVLTTEGATWLQNLNDQIAVLRGQLV